MGVRAGTEGLGEPTAPPGPTEPWGLRPPDSPAHLPVSHSVCRNGRLQCMQVMLLSQSKWPLPRVGPLPTPGRR